MDAGFCFREKYGENLPSNWQELVENCPRIIKDKVVNGLLVLLPNNEVCGHSVVNGGSGYGYLPVLFYYTRYVYTIINHLFILINIVTCFCF